MTSRTIAERRAAFRQLHESGCFVIPNPWDIGTTRYLQHLGFKALATTSSGLSFSKGLPDTDWAVRHVLQYGPDAEVLEPEEVRAAILARLERLI